MRGFGNLNNYDTNPESPKIEGEMDFYVVTDENLVPHFSRVGAMTFEEWCAPALWIEGCEAILCELSPDFRLHKLSNLGSFLDAALQAIADTIKTRRHKCADRLAAAWETFRRTDAARNGQHWVFLFECDVILSASKKWRASYLHRNELRKKERRVYTLRGVRAWVKRIEEVESTPVATLVH